MFFKRRHVEQGFKEAVKQHAPDFVRAVYQALLNRDADAGGLQHYVNHLRGEGSIESMLSQFSQGEEFIALVDQRRPSHIENRTLALKSADKQIAIFANCQGSNLARCIQTLTGRQPPRSTFVSADDMARPERVAERLQQALAENDAVIVQTYIVRGLEKKLGLQLPMDKVVVLPQIGFGGFHPDFCSITIGETATQVIGPLGSYQSSIVFHAWRAGMSSAQAVDLFCESFFEQLGFFEACDRDAAHFLNRAAQYGLPAQGLLDGWRRRGCFMHAPSHPKLFVLADIARVVLERLAVPTLSVEPEAVLRDPLGELPVCPVYPEIARRLGIAGGYHFKADSHTLDGMAPVQWFGLDEFVERSFAAFNTHPERNSMVCARAFGRRFEGLLGSKTKWCPTQVTAMPSHPAPRGHPYAALPSRQFWGRALAQAAVEGIDPVDAAAFQIDSKTRVATGGSCFAQHIAQRLRKRGFNYVVTETAPPELSATEALRQQYGVYSARFGNLYTVRQLLQLFDRAHGDFNPAEAPWLRSDGRLADPFRPEIAPDGFADTQTLEAARTTHLAAVCEMFDSVEVFVFTLGLTEAWRSKKDGAVFPLAPGVVAGAMDMAHYEFVNFGTAEVLADLEAFQSRLAMRNPAARLLLTVSPVPLAATYEPHHVLTANTYSKSVLRAAAGEFCRRHPQCGYFPSYEIVTGNFNRSGYFAPDLRSVNAAGVDHVMRLFFTHYATGSSVVIDADLLEQAQINDELVCEEQHLAKFADTEAGTP